MSQLNTVLTDAYRELIQAESDYMNACSDYFGWDTSGEVRKLRLMLSRILDRISELESPIPCRLARMPAEDARPIHTRRIER